MLHLTPAELEALRHDRQRLAWILEGTNVATWEWNVQTGETRFDERWATIIGWSLDELQPVSIQTWVDHTHPDDLARSGELLNRHFSGELPYYECEARMRHRDGHWIWVLDRGRVAEWTEDGKPLWMYGTHMDITARHQMEDELRESRSFLERTGSLAGIGGWEVDLATMVSIWSEQTRRLHEVADDFVPDLDSAIGFYPGEAADQIRSAIETAIRTGGSWDLELPFITARGNHRWVRVVGAVEQIDGQSVRLVGAFQDVSERKRLEQQLVEGRELLRMTLESIGDAVITTHPDGRVHWLNPAAQRLTGWSEAEAAGLPLPQVFRTIHQDTREPTPDPVSECLDQGHMVLLQADSVLVSRHGLEFAVEDSAAPIRGRNGEVLGAVLVFRDVSEQRRMVRQMHHQAHHDALTGLANRLEFEQVLGELHPERNGRTHALMYIDLDQFKRVNDSCGHAAGDRLLHEVAQQLRSLVRQQDLLARLGGDEFGLLLVDCPMQQAQRVAQSLCDRVEQYRFRHEGEVYRIGASVGLVQFDDSWTDAGAALQAADAACYAAKEAGRNRVYLWSGSDERLQGMQGDLRWTQRLEQALDDDRFELFGQEIMPVAHQEAKSVEVLLRMRTEQGELILPGAFMVAVERFGLAGRIDRWVLRKTLDWLGSLGDARHQLRQVHVNLSAHSLGDVDFQRQVSDWVAATPHDLSMVCLEITETAAISQVGEAARFVEAMRAPGLRIALDDFGAGASNFAYLRALPVDYLKIDGQFVRGVSYNELDRVSVSCFIDVARVVGVETIAEFVDSAESRTVLEALGVDYLQGFLLHRPEPLSQWTARRLHAPVH